MVSGFYHILDKNSMNKKSLEVLSLEVRQISSLQNETGHSLFFFFFFLLFFLGLCGKEILVPLKEYTDYKVSGKG